MEVVSSIEGFDAIVADLRRRNTCLATWHTVHTAALLVRGTGSRLVRFFPQTDAKSPDFIVEHDGHETMCEAKLLSKSGPQEAFERYAARLSSTVRDVVLKEERPYPTLTIVLRDVTVLPPLEQVITRVVEGIAQFSDSPIEYRNKFFNIFIVPRPQEAGDLTSARSIYVLCPKSEREDLRVHQRGAEASRQLISEVGSGQPGLLLLGITQMQDPGYVADLFRRRFSSGHYPGIAGALLIYAGTHMGEPMRAPMDLVRSIRNEQAQRPLPNLPLWPVGLIGQLPIHSSESVPAYRHLWADARVAEGSGGQFVPDLRTLDASMLSAGNPEELNR
ncbi:MAG: hypothetical protein HZC22_19600 [Rhodocyclales bacterium]|nr:hypothetical protein [Rhodocyclales bacterium]